MCASHVYAGTDPDHFADRYTASTADDSAYYGADHRAYYGASHDRAFRDSCNS